MLIIPAVDIKNGKCVRLFRGDFKKETIYSNNPVKMAQKWEMEGAKMLHIIDLDGAKSGRLTNLKIIKHITKRVKIPVQVGGGIRDIETIRRLIELGVARVVVGTLALENEYLLQKIINSYADQIIVALDVKKGRLMKKGWLLETNKDVVPTAKYLGKLGVQRFIYTDVIKDGTMARPNYKEIANLLRNILVPVVVSGGIADIAAVKKLKSIGAESIIIGKALYEGKIKLQEAINVS